MNAINKIKVTRTLSDPVEIEQRRSLLHRPHMNVLCRYVGDLRRSDVGSVPDFDPLDGGTNARMLFLLEKPGPKAIKSGFISRDNNDSTAEATLRFMERAQIPRSEVLLWNVMPAWNGTTKVSRAELEFGISCLDKLIGILPRLRSIVFVGRKAERAMPQFAGRGFNLHFSFHPSPKNYATARDKWESIPNSWAKAWTNLQ